MAGLRKDGALWAMSLSLAGCSAGLPDATDASRSDATSDAYLAMVKDAGPTDGAALDEPIEDAFRNACFPDGLPPPWDGALATDIFVLPPTDAGCGDGGGTPVDPAVLTGSVPACAPGYAHPNVCCLGSPAGNTVCTEDPNSPFAMCGCGALFFPDPHECCPLDGGSACVAPTSDAGPPRGTACKSPCEIGEYLRQVIARSLDSGDVDCRDVPYATYRGFLLYAAPYSCEFCCQGDWPQDFAFCGSNFSNSITPCPPLVSVVCGCPGGWQPVQGVPDLCCRGGDAGTKCFSQSTWNDQAPPIPGANP